MDKKKQMLFNVNNFLLAVTEILDVRDCEINGVTKHHSLRVAFLSLKIAEKLNFESKEMFDLCAYSLFHNYASEERLNLLDIDNRSNKLSDIVKFVHKIDQKFDFSNQNIENRYLIIAELKKEKSNIFAKILLESTNTIELWLDCQFTDSMLQYIYSTLHDFTVTLDFEKVLEITIMFGSLYENVEKLVQRGAVLCDYYNFEHKDKLTFLIAVSMMNFGKLAIPSKLIDKKEKLTNEEFEMVKSNVYFIKNALQKIYAFDDISKLASRHHEKLDGDGYPQGIGANALSLKDRLIAVLNIYNSLLCKKSYRDIFTEKQTIKIIHKKVQNKEIDKTIVEDLEHAFS
jgi:HD-GYP domain-containing protein (c-di-GMP phosphodiesterase class II)